MDNERKMVDNFPRSRLSYSKVLEYFSKCQKQKNPQPFKSQGFVIIFCDLGKNRTCILGTGNLRPIHCTTKPFVLTKLRKLI